MSDDATRENTSAIRELVILVGQTTKDVDKLTKKIDGLIPVHEKINSISIRISNIEDTNKRGFSPATTKLLMYGVVSVALIFGTWVTDKYYTFHEDYIKTVGKIESRKKTIDGRIKRRTVRLKKIEDNQKRNFDRENLERQYRLSNNTKEDEIK